MTEGARLSLPLATLETAKARAKAVLEGAFDEAGSIPNMYAAMANAPARFDAYLHCYSLFDSRRQADCGRKASNPCRLYSSDVRHAAAPAKANSRLSWCGLLRGKRPRYHSCHRRNDAQHLHQSRLRHGGRREHSGFRMDAGNIVIEDMTSQRLLSAS